MKEEIRDVVLSILGVHDPVSMPSEERKKTTRSSEFFSAAEEDLIEAYMSIPVAMKQPHFDDLFEFLINVRRFADAYQESGELWEAFGDCESPQLVNIQLDAHRRTGRLAVARFTRQNLVELTKDPRQKMWAEFYLPRLDALKGKVMILLFTDDAKSRLFGFPFDIMLSSTPSDESSSQQ